LYSKGRQKVRADARSILSIIPLRYELFLSMQPVPDKVQPAVTVILAGRLIKRYSSCLPYRLSNMLTISTHY